MKVKVGNKVYDGRYEAVMVVLEPQDKKNIRDMKPDAKHYCVYPSDEFTIDGIKQWMKCEENTTQITK